MRHRSLKDKGVHKQKFILIYPIPLNNRQYIVRTAEPDLTPLYCESINDKRDLAEDSKLGVSAQCYMAGKKDHSGWNTESQTEVATAPFTSTFSRTGLKFSLLPYQQEVSDSEET